MLGADLEEVDGFYRIARIYSGEDWTPGLQGPLSQPGMDVTEGDYLISVDGRALRAPTNPYELLEGTAGRAITIQVNDSPTAQGARRLVVEPVSRKCFRHNPSCPAISTWSAPG